MHLKAYHPAAFYCALLNQQPMGFYRPEVIIGDARRHGVRLLPPDINRSDWRYTVEGERKLRAGLQAVSELGETAWARIGPARTEGPFADLRDLCARTRLSHEVVANLIRAGACDGLGDRRALLWALGGIDIRPEELPLDAPPMDADLPVLTDTERTAWEYELMGLSAHGQALRHLREAFNRAGIASTAEVKALPGGRIVRTAGMVVVRQRPQTAKGMVFMSLEDEFGLLDVVFRPDVYERCRKSIRGQTVILVDGELQKASGAISVLAHRARGWEG
jgi:error-prone DNA polymerase